MCKVPNATAIVSDDAGRDSQGGTCDESVLISSLFKLLKLVKGSFMFLKEKKINLWLSYEESGR